MAECTPSGDSFSYTTTITLINNITGSYDVSTYASIADDNPSADWQLLQAATPYTNTGVSNIDENKKTLTKETIEKTITTSYSITFRRVATVCESGPLDFFGEPVPGATTKCSEWYLGSGANNCLDNPNAPGCIQNTPPFDKSKSKITSIIDLGFQPDKFSQSNEANAIKAHQQKIDAAIEEINSKVGIKIKETKKTTKYLIGYVPKTFYLRLFVDHTHQYDSDDGTSTFSLARLKYNVQKTTDLLGWKTYSGDIFTNTTVCYKTIDGVPDPNNKFKYVCPPELVKGIYYYGYGGDRLDALDEKSRALYSKATGYAVNVHDCGVDVTSGLPSPDLATPLVTVYGGQGVSILTTPEGPIGGLLYECVNPALPERPEYGYFDPCPAPSTAPRNTLGACYHPTGRTLPPKARETMYSTGDCSTFEYRNPVYGVGTSSGPEELFDKIYKYGEWEVSRVNQDVQVDIIEERSISDLQNTSINECEAGPPTTTVNGTPYPNGKGSSCRCN